MSRGVAWHFYIFTVLLVALFIVLPAVAGTWIAVCLARYLDRRSFQLLAGLMIVLVILFGAVWWKAQPSTDEILESRVLEILDQTLVKTRFAQFPFLPSYWLTSSVLQWTEGALRASGFFMLVLLSHVGFFGCITFTRFGTLFYESASAAFGRPKLRFRWGSTRGPGAISRTEWFWNRIVIIPADIRALILKDMRTFWRDTAQWGQTVMLFGLLTVYIANLRHFTHQLTSPFWINLISYLNLAACSLNLATLTTRFVFPQFSLEGQRLWIVGMAPMGLDRVVKAKYWLASTASLVVTVSLITLSSVLLNMTWDRIGYFASVVVVMTFALNGLAVGLGVLYPNFKEAQPSKIVSGFGGTLCLVISFLYILASVLLLGFGTAGRHPNPTWVFGSVAAFTIISFLVGWLPLKLGLWHLPNFEV
jgi:ABC-2 type transport system permease protein